MTKDQSYREMEYGTFDKATETERTSNIEKKREIFIEELNVLNHDKCPYGNWLSLIRTLYFKE